ncbi:Rieske (2Fe-2S) protein [Micromonospora sp. RHAY321]|uniref:Rieske (2Fe-2S) protein n=1 Tax=Micromonospora sp. RHAY321 TaxID=2944807 RepID=UPI00207D651A|nr:Rieske 2Fe-2S domain-containing protein [Micromonospora sp. RHAY321]MCO1594773.1 Rieske (2Fe-2S) protein [Micromonospora sp. RHAY321]
MTTVYDGQDFLRDNRWCLSRRALLTGAGAVGAAGLLSACGAGDTPAGGAAATAGTVLARTGDVPVGGGTVVDGVLVVQPEAGTFTAYDATCPHQGVRVGAPRDGVITCPAHNSTFSAGDGARLGGPATRGLTEIPVRVDGTDILRA